MRLKLSPSEWKTINKRSGLNWFNKYLYSYYMHTSDNSAILLEQKINLILYLLLFIPAHISQLLILTWNSGIKNFKIVTRNVNYTKVYPWNEKYEAANKVLKNHLNNS